MKHKIIDPHIHLFDLTKGQYHWLQTNNPPFWPDKHIIQKNFTEQDLQLNNNFILEGIVHIEAGFDNDSPLKEINFLQTTIINTPFKAVAFIDLTLPSKEFKLQLSKLQQHKNNQLIGIRHIMEGTDSDLIFNENLFTNLTLLAELNLIFEAQFEFHDLNATKQLAIHAKSLSSLKIVINHCGLVTQGKYELWQQAISILSPYENIHIKCSGWEMDNRQYKQLWLEKIVNHLLSQFGENRIMLASNFPLCLFSKSYNNLWQSYYDLNLPNNIWQAISFDNAKDTYQLEAKPSITV
ncbi:MULTISPECIES: amidohydrolase [unclassified Pseudoalteromonas]|uniref:amidohydrolase family protein n=1 Tax=unclassified Pseudoalteromonas TaxID=194690 RepID=UPI0005A702C5|nr:MULTISPECIES: amidohydrolase family protein [unclassified Pseudoalteromonas]